MKYLVISDNHSQLHPMDDIIDTYRNRVDYVVHCGDSEFSFSDPVFSGVYAVRGNCDFDTRFPDELTVGEVFVAHGHLLGVKSSLRSLAKAAKSHGKRIAFYGHTHVFGVDDLVDDVVCINPGSISLPKGPNSEYKTVAIVEVDSSNRHVLVNYYDAQMHELSQFSTSLDY